jgi:hypothetical protein
VFTEDSLLWLILCSLLMFLFCLIPAPANGTQQASSMVTERCCHPVKNLVNFRILLLSNYLQISE